MNDLMRVDREHRARNSKCVFVGHRVRFHAQDRTMTWACEWCGGHAGSKTYDSAVAARKYARAFDRRDGQDVGKRAPLLGMFPLRLWRFLRNRKDAQR
jgi:hypothetical protein